MSVASPFAVPANWLAGAHLAKVRSVQDPQRMGRVQVQLYAADPSGEALQWARVAVPFAGNNYGAFLIPHVDEEVLVLFAGNDVRYPVVVGALWNGRTDAPEELQGDAVDKWTLTGRNGTRIAILEQTQGQDSIELETPGGVNATLTDANGGEISLTVGASSITISQSGIAVECSGEFSVDAGTISLTAGSISATAGSSDFSGSISCASITTSSVVSGSYTPGAGNIW